MRKRVIDFIKKEYSIEPDYPFKDDYADCAVFRHLINQKWFGLIMNIEYQKLGINKSGKCDIINLKTNPHEALFLREEAGVIPAYHMNKTHWNSVLLDGTVKYSFVCEMIKSSYNLIAGKKKKRD